MCCCGPMNGSPALTPVTSSYVSVLIEAVVESLLCTRCTCEVFGLGSMLSSSMSSQTPLSSLFDSSSAYPLDSSTVTELPLSNLYVRGNASVHASWSRACHGLSQITLAFLPVRTGH